MGKKIDLTGKRFGQLVVLKEVPIEERTSKRVQWYCQCDCGQITKVVTCNLNNGHTQSCGCKRAESMSKTMSTNLVGDRFGKLVVIEKSDFRASDGCIMWKCQCDCGKITFVNTNSLKNGDIESCGCIRSRGERKINQILFENNIKFYTQYGFDDLKQINKLRFDFGIFNDNDELIALIEYQGIQHYQPELMPKEWKNADPRERDEKKREYCKKHNINLIEIPYTDFNIITWEYLKNKLNL